MRDCTLIIPYYRNPLMLARQLTEIAAYVAGWKVIIVDDGSPEPAEPIVRAWLAEQPTHLLWARDMSLYRIDVDIPWNREGARNLASRECQTEWMVHVDIDHVLPAQCARRLIHSEWWNSGEFYRFSRHRVGAADETRKKDRIPTTAEFGEIHPHVDSYLCTKDAYWKAGGYNEDFSGILGGGGEFLRRLGKTAHATIAPPDVHLRVYTRHAIADASDLYCSRELADVRRLERVQREAGNPPPTSWLRFPWHRVL